MAQEFRAALDDDGTVKAPETDLLARLDSLGRAYQIGPTIAAGAASIRSLRAQLAQVTAEMVTARIDALEEAAALCDRISADVEAVNDEYSAKRLPGICIEPECTVIAQLIRSLASTDKGGQSDG
jgi:hypothetical protein